MGDLISRQTLIEHLRSTIEASSNDGDYNEGFNDGMDFAACFASTLPSAQSEIIKCKDCIHRYKKINIPMCDFVDFCPTDSSYCSLGEK